MHAVAVDFLSEAMTSPMYELRTVTRPVDDVSRGAVHFEAA
jgi:hypothetical protein